MGKHGRDGGQAASELQCMPPAICCQQAPQHDHATTNLWSIRCKYQEHSPHLSLAAALDFRVVISLVACNEQHVSGADRKGKTPPRDELRTYRIDVLLLHLQLVLIPAVALRFSDGMRQCGAVDSSDGNVSEACIL